MRLALIGIALIVFGLLGGLYLFFVFDWTAEIPADKGKMLHELFKFSIATMIVGGAGLLYQYLQSEYEARRARRSFLEEFLREVTTSYNRIKFIRRKLRREMVRADGGEFHISIADYQKLMDELNLGQLELEQFARIMESDPEPLREVAKDGVSQVRTAEHYLRKVTKEYENRVLNETDDGKSYRVTPNTRLLKWAAARKDRAGDESVHQQHFTPLDNFYKKLREEISGRKGKDAPNPKTTKTSRSWSV
ncbi:hypothetical protein [Ruegeria jejuensis]|uniref:hypothetical protein n=1 Tax=Ruegeria jejuensis TaxID=3233338 RepID=UPI00355BCA68